MDKHDLSTRVRFGSSLEQLRQRFEDVDDKNEYVTARDSWGRTALHGAALFNYFDIACLLIENATSKSTYVRMKDDENQTALHLAAGKRGSLPLVKELIRHLTDDTVSSYVNEVSKDGSTALNSAVAAGDGYTTFFLLEKGASVAKKDWRGNNAWDIALNYGEPKWGVIAALILHEGKCDPNGLLVWLGWEVIKINSVGLGHFVRYSRETLINDPQITDQSIECLARILVQVRQAFNESQEAPQHLRSREPSCIFHTLDYPIFGSKDFISLVMPFISVDELLTMAKRKAKSSKATESLRYCISKDGEWLENHMALTLDEYCSPALPQEVLKFRNRDQVLVRHERKRQERGNATATLTSDIGGESAPGLLKELWILVRPYVNELRRLIDPRTWKFSKRRPPKETVVKKNSSSTDAVFIRQVWIWKVGSFAISTLPREIANDLYWNGAFTYTDKRIGIAFILKHVIELIDKPSSETPRSLLKIYENELSVISEEVNQYMKSVLVEDIDIDQEKAFFHQISDFREELSMIKSVLAEQEEVWKEFMGKMWPRQELGQQQDRTLNSEETEPSLPQFPTGFRNEEDWNAVWRPRVLFNKYRRRITKLEGDAERVERNISTQLDLKQKHAALKEAHSTAIVGAMVFGFTIVTVVFAPLSFVAALFALPIDKFNEGKDGHQKDGVYSSNYIGKWSAATVLVSIAVTLLAMWVGLQFAGLHIWGKKGLRAYIRQKASNIHAEEKSLGGEDTEEEDIEEEEAEERNTAERNTEEGGTEEGGREQTAGNWTRLKRTIGKWPTNRGGNSTTDVELGPLGSRR
ncbi:hypothetical protein F5Y00DRAFT_268639 [Daldinia vernicosa]|uniref:uncharacterized protein n=1 Tax=Daldinia vernicosa TaxID=114800 RepID=UPI0020074919|nr:uncharacterized protein F5Y00DRAFT_268639 [Daldinia vernicosa]KAI0850186.1 hypothetical protein F5Y00DRAFT_268639 [Daldinia vernicosa]